MCKILDIVCINEDDPIVEDMGFDEFFVNNYHCAQSYKENGRVGVIYDDKKTIPPIYETISLFSLGDNHLTIYAVVKYNGKYGLLTCENQVIEECIYDSISYFYKPKENNRFSSRLTSSLKCVLSSEYKYIDLYSNTEIKSTNNYDRVGLFKKLFSHSPSVLSNLEWEEDTLSTRSYYSKKRYAIVKGDSSGIILDDGTFLFESNMFKEIRSLFIHTYEYRNELYYELRSYVVFHNGYMAWVNHEGKVFGIFNPIYKSMVDLNNYNRTPGDDDYRVVVSPSKDKYYPLYRYSRDNNGEYAALNVYDKWGIVDENNNILVDFKYDSFGKLINRNQPVNPKPIDNEKNKIRVRSGYSYTDEPQTFEQYNGSYAQDEMGYSDDDIDTIFDGDPLAYWNID